MLNRLLAPNLVAKPVLFDMQAATISRYRRKHGTYSYKFGPNKWHKNPHPIKIKTRAMLKKQGYEGQLKIHDRERTSDKPFGYSSSKGKFRYNMEKVPFYHVPDLTGFKLKPYVAWNTPRIDADKKVERKVDLDEELLAQIEKQIEDATSGRLATMGDVKMDKGKR